MRALVFRTIAEEDLTEIRQFIAGDNPVAARRFIESLERKCTLLKTAPFIGRSREELAQGLRSIPFGHYHVFYTVTEETVVIERVLHGRRRIEREF